VWQRLTSSYWFRVCALHLSAAHLHPLSIYPLPIR
jgi:hypothetical protein